MHEQIKALRKELTALRNEAVAAHIAGDTEKADCLTGKAVGIKSTLDLAERVVEGKDRVAIGELEGMAKVVHKLTPVPKC